MSMDFNLNLEKINSSKQSSVSTSQNQQSNEANSIFDSVETTEENSVYNLEIDPGFEIDDVTIFGTSESSESDVDPEVGINTLVHIIRKDSATGTIIQNLEDVENSETIEKYKDLIEDIINAKDDDSIESPEDIISGWLESGYIDEEMADNLRNEYVTYSDEDEAIIQAELEAAQISNPDITREEVIQELTESGKIGDPLITAETPLSEMQTEDEEEVENEPDLQKITYPTAAFDLDIKPSDLPEITEL